MQLHEACFDLETGCSDVHSDKYERIAMFQLSLHCIWCKKKASLHKWLMQLQASPFWILFTNVDLKFIPGLTCGVDLY